MQRAARPVRSRLGARIIDPLHRLEARREPFGDQVRMRGDVPLEVRCVGLRETPHERLRRYPRAIDRRRMKRHIVEQAQRIAQADDEVAPRGERTGHRLQQGEHRVEALLVDVAVPQ